jgi:hypothetical protein
VKGIPALAERSIVGDLINLVAAPASAPVELLLPSGVVLRLPPDTDLLWPLQALPATGIRLTAALRLSHTSAWKLY